MKPLSNQDIQTIIIDDSQAERCAIGCGMDWSLPENINLARQRIKESFGSSVILDYVDAEVEINPAGKRDDDQ